MGALRHPPMLTPWEQRSTRPRGQGMNDGGQVQEFQQRDPFQQHSEMMRSMMGGMMGGSMFGGGMFGGGMLSRMLDDDFMGGGGMGSTGGMGGGSFSMSSFSSSSMDGGQPRVVQYSSSTTMGPGGVQETKKTYSDSATGDQRMQHQRRIGDRGRSITKTRNIHSGDMTEDDSFIGMDASDAQEFDREFQKGRVSGWSRPSSARETRTSDYMPAQLDYRPQSSRGGGYESGAGHNAERYEQSTPSWGSGYAPGPSASASGAYRPGSYGFGGRGF